MSNGVGKVVFGVTDVPFLSDALRFQTSRRKPLSGSHAVRLERTGGTHGQPNLFRARKAILSSFPYNTVKNTEARRLNHVKMSWSVIRGKQNRPQHTIEHLGFCSGSKQAFSSATNPLYALKPPQSYTSTRLVPTNSTARPVIRRAIPTARKVSPPQAIDSALPMDFEEARKIEEERLAKERDARLQRKLRFQRIIAQRAEALRYVEATSEDIENFLQRLRENLLPNIRAARIQAVADVKKRRLQNMLAPKLARASQIAHGLEGEFDAWSSEVANYRQSLLERAQTFEATRDPRSKFGQLQAKGRALATNVGHGHEDLFNLLDPEAGLVDLRADLIRHGIWQQNPTKAQHTSPGSGFLRTTNNQPLRRALIDLMLWPGFPESDIPMYMHGLRSLQRNVHLGVFSSELFAHYLRRKRGAVLFGALIRNTVAIARMVRQLRTIFELLGYPLENTYILRMNAELAATLVRSAAEDYRVTLNVLALPEHKFDMRIHRNLVNTMQPFEEYLGGFRLIKIELLRIILGRRRLRDLANDQSTALFHEDVIRKLRRELLTEILTNTTRALRDEIEPFLVWRSARCIIEGPPKPQRYSHPQKFGGDSQKEIGGLDLLPLVQYSGKALEKPPSEPMWMKRSSLLYGLDETIPIHYIIGDQDAHDFAKRLSTHKILGFDVLMVQRSTSGRFAGKTSVEFILIASPDEVVIFDMSHLSPLRAGVWDGLDNQIFANPSILKVGVHIELQRRVLLQDWVIHLVNAYEVAAPMPTTTSMLSKTDPTFSTLSALALQNCRRSLVPRMLDKNFSRIAFLDPVGWFRDLALRPLVALQTFDRLYFQAHRKSMALINPNASLGPIAISTSVQRYDDDELTKTSVGPRSNLYISMLSRRLARMTTGKNKYLLARRHIFDPTSWRFALLQSYIMFTTFSTPFQYQPRLQPLQFFLDSTNRANLHALIYVLAREAQLPLRQEHVFFLFGKVFGYSLSVSSNIRDHPAFVAAQALLDGGHSRLSTSRMKHGPSNIRFLATTLKAKTRPSTTALKGRPPKFKAKKSVVNPIQRLATASASNATSTEPSAITSEAKQPPRLKITRILTDPPQQTAIGFGSPIATATEPPAGRVESPQPERIEKLSSSRKLSSPRHSFRKIRTEAKLASTVTSPVRKTLSIATGIVSREGKVPVKQTPSSVIASQTMVAPEMSPKKENRRSRRKRLQDEQRRTLLNKRKSKALSSVETHRVEDSAEPAPMRESSATQRKFEMDIDDILYGG